MLKTEYLRGFAVTNWCYLLTLLSDHSEQLGRETSRLQPIVGVVEFSAGSISSA
jgi:hypothetical protein